MTASKIIETARAELGYIGKKSNAYLYDKTANITGKFTKYAADLAAAGYYNGNKNGFDWCCCFIDWLFYMSCGGKEDANAVKPTGIYGAGVYWAYKEYKDHGMTVSDPRPGDQIFFVDTDGELSHTGLVVEVGPDYVSTIEGNWDNQVLERTYDRSSKRIAGYGRPNYEPEPEPEPDVIQVRPEDLDELLVQLRTIEGALSDAAEALQKASEELTKVYQEAESYAND